MGKYTFKGETPDDFWISSISLVSATHLSPSVGVPGKIGSCFVSPPRAFL